MCRSKRWPRIHQAACHDLTVSHTAYLLQNPGFEFSLGQHLVSKSTMYDMIIDPTQKFVATACQDRNIRSVCVMLCNIRLLCGMLCNIRSVYGMLCSIRSVCDMLRNIRSVCGMLHNIRSIRSDVLCCTTLGQYVVCCTALGQMCVVQN